MVDLAARERWHTGRVDDGFDGGGLGHGAHGRDGSGRIVAATRASLETWTSPTPRPARCCASSCSRTSPGSRPTVWPAASGARRAPPAATSRSCARRGCRCDSVRGPYGGYRLGRGVRLPPLMFSATEALGLVMAVLDGHHDAGDPTDPVGGALGKMVRALPESVADQAEASAARPPRPPTAAPPGPTRRRPPPSSRPARRTGGSGCGTGRRRARSGRPRSTRGRSSSGTAGGTCCAAPGPTAVRHTGSTGCATSSRWTSGSTGPPTWTR